MRQDLIYRHISHHGFWTFNWLRQASREDINAHYQEIAGLVAVASSPPRSTAPIRSTNTPKHSYHAEQYQRSGKVLFTLGE